MLKSGNYEMEINFPLRYTNSFKRLLKLANKIMIAQSIPHKILIVVIIAHINKITNSLFI